MVQAPRCGIQWANIQPFENKNMICCETNVHVSIRPTFSSISLFVIVQGQMYRYGVDAGDTLISETDDDCELSYNQNITIYGKDFTNIFVSDE